MQLLAICQMSSIFRGGAFGAVLPGEGQLGHDHDFSISPRWGSPIYGGVAFLSASICPDPVDLPPLGCGNLSAFLPLSFEGLLAFCH